MKKPIKTALAGAFVGTLNGLFGSGGGVAAVFLLKKLFGCDTKTAHATAVMVIMPLSLTSIIIYLFKGDIPLTSAAFTSIGGIFGGLLGAKLLKKLKAGWITKIFAIAMIAGAIRIFMR